MPIRSVRYGQVMRCGKCRQDFLVSALVGGASVYHGACGAELELQLSLDDVEAVVLAMVELSLDNNRLEVRPGLGVT